MIQRNLLLRPFMIYYYLLFFSDEFLVVLVGGRLYALAHGVRQKFAQFGVAAGAAVRGVDAAEVERLDAQRSAALQGGGICSLLRVRGRWRERRRRRPRES